MSGKVVFYRPNTIDKPAMTYYAPLGLMALGAYLREYGYEPIIVDYQSNKDPIKRLIDESRDAVFIGITSMTGHQIIEGLKAAKAIRDAGIKKPLVWGGWHPSLFPKQTARHPLVDVVVKGFGEQTSIELLEAFKNDGDLSGIKGIAFKTPSGNVVENPDRPLPEDFDRFPMLGYDLIDVNDYNHLPINYSLYDPYEMPMERMLEGLNPPYKIISYFTSYGCVHNCGFCSVSGLFHGKWFGYSADRVVEDITNLNHRYGINLISLEDSNFFVNLGRVRRIAEGLIKSGIKIRWLANLQAATGLRISDDLWQLLKKAGLFGVYVGTESGSQKVLDIIGKGYDVKYNELLADKLERNKIYGTFSYIIGIPGERKTDKYETIKQIKRIAEKTKHIKCVFSLYTPYPATPLYPLAKYDGFTEPSDFEGWAKFETQTQNTGRVSIKEYHRILILSSIFFLRYGSGLLSIPKLFFYGFLKMMGSLRLKLKTTFMPFELIVLKSLYYGLLNRLAFFVKGRTPLL